MAKKEEAVGVFTVRAFKGYWRQAIGTVLGALLLMAGAAVVTTCNKYKAAFDAATKAELLRELDAMRQAQVDQGVSPEKAVTPNQAVEQKMKENIRNQYLKPDKGGTKR